ncbi:hypothetical protein [Paenibacillus sp. MBLB4367]|uniref:hypothetical protein n=1 Tax=Paenibacillus sp. MBLB4367 TaxID=3384767 RepID=UPI0039083DFA
MKANMCPAVIPPARKAAEAISQTYSFNKDGTFFDNKFVGHTTDGSGSGDQLYRIRNESAQTVHVNSLKVTLQLTDASAQATSGLAPKVKDELKPGESVEKMSVILLPADRFETSKDFELGFGPLNNLEGKDVFQNEWLGFYVWRDL